jgi:hypothetical protein
MTFELQNDSTLHILQGAVIVATITSADAFRLAAAIIYQLAQTIPPPPPQTPPGSLQIVPA